MSSTVLISTTLASLQHASSIHKRVISLPHEIILYGPPKPILHCSRLAHWRHPSNSMRIPVPSLLLPLLTHNFPADSFVFQFSRRLILSAIPTRSHATSSTILMFSALHRPIPMPFDALGFVTRTSTQFVRHSPNGATRLRTASF